MSYLSNFLLISFINIKIKIRQIGVQEVFSGRGG